ncbi:T9SS type A sorting domain-containing protein [Flavobacterium sp.]|uniref:T9SS type A sorting domain-containing protein n=1 Tax=Flavobacterium sp. TaxID=239 RepID=UPI00391B7583
MRKITFCISILFIQGLFAQITLTPFTPDIPFSGFTSSLDAFGNEIAISGSHAHDFSQTMVFVFEKNGTTISQETYFTPTDFAPFDNFGEKVSIDNDFIAASSRLNDQVASNAGAVYMYRKVAGNWTFFEKITAFDGVVDDYFGTDVKVIGNQLFVSAINNEPIGQPTTTNSGAVYVYNFNGLNWIFSQKIIQSGTYNFGNKIKVANNQLVIAAGTDLHTYNFDGSNWNFSSTFASSTMVDFDLDNNQLFVLRVTGFSSNIDIYNEVADTWNLNTTVTSLNFNDRMPTNFEVKNNLMFISLNFHPLLYTGKTPVAMFKKIGGVWSYQELIYGVGPFEHDDGFGSQMAISNSIVVIGAPIERMPQAYGGNAYTIDVTLGVNENTLNDLEIYPNPTSDLVYLTNDLGENISTIGIYQFDGKLIKKVKYSQNPISLNEFQNGVYLLKITWTNGISTCKRIVKI